MTTMISEVYTALKEAGAPEESARRAAEAPAQEQLATKADVAHIEKELAVIKWMLALVVAAEVLPILKAVFAPG
ncbi:MAG: integrase [Magnetococcales bacterium]|nr:integrase [Magnetococcales bacterium]